MSRPHLSGEETPESMTSAMEFDLDQLVQGASRRMAESSGTGATASETAPAALDHHKKIKNIVTVGAGHVGGPSSAVIAKNNPDIMVHVVDIDRDRITAWKKKPLPIYEPGLDDLVELCRDGMIDDKVGNQPHVPRRTPNLFFSDNILQAIDEADLIFICVDTPLTFDSGGRGAAADLRNVDRVVRMVAEAATDDKIIVEKSTVPCKTAQAIGEVVSLVGLRLGGPC